MRELTDRELYQALQYAKSQDENAGRSILQQFQTEQSALAQTIFGVFSALIADKDKDLANLFMDLCFDVICVFRHAFGDLPDQRVLNMEWLQNTAALLDAELQAFMPGNKMDTKFRDKFQNRFTERLTESDSQAGLVKFMDDAISAYVADSPADPDAVRTARTMIYVVIQLFGAMYDQAERQATAS
ncbi:hypothetical protein CWO84_20585 [Methylomonas sp. Kb3]|uniref:hypothetical protein n=1 Tax=Methylomonas sp. Kb3 TaxID=1611544 RepID=UPI000C3204DB|nr:hypothetical protein [Methylomonas sp. Kb3]PKD38625.1 hypothetical protein CWO84_20585 [Methylomonas sp. Kb3]